MSFSSTISQAASAPFRSPQRRASMAEPNVDPVLGPVADLLATRHLTDPDLLDLTSWRRLVEPVTRPLTRRVLQQLQLPRMRLLTATSARRKRRSFDMVNVPLVGGQL